MSQLNKIFTINNLTINMGNTCIIVADNLSAKEYISDYSMNIFPFVSQESYLNYKSNLIETMLSCLQNNNIRFEFIFHPSILTFTENCYIYNSTNNALLIILPISTNYCESGKSLHKLLVEKNKINKKLKEENVKLEEQATKLKEEHARTVHFENTNMPSDNLLKSFESEFDNLHIEIARLRSENDSLKQQNDEYKKTKNVDNVIISDLIKTVKKDKINNERLKEDIQNLNDFISSLEYDLPNYDELSHWV